MKRLLTENAFKWWLGIAAASVLMFVSLRLITLWFISESNQPTRLAILWLNEYPYKAIDDSTMLSGPIVNANTTFGAWKERGLSIPKLKETLEGMLASNDSRVNVREVCFALSFLGDSNSVKVLVATLNNEDASARSQAVWALTTIGNEAAVKPLCKTAKLDQDIVVRLKAMYGLKTLGTEMCRECLQVLSSDQNQEIAANARSFLTNLDKKEAAR